MITTLSVIIRDRLVIPWFELVDNSSREIPCELLDQVERRTDHCIAEGTGQESESSGTGRNFPRECRTLHDKETRHKSGEPNRCADNNTGAANARLVSSGRFITVRFLDRSSVARLCSHHRSAPRPP